MNCREAESVDLLYHQFTASLAPQLCECYDLAVARTAATVRVLAVFGFGDFHFYGFSVSRLDWLDLSDLRAQARRSSVFQVLQFYR